MSITPSPACTLVPRGSCRAAGDPIRVDQLGVVDYAAARETQRAHAAVAGRVAIAAYDSGAGQGEAGFRPHDMDDALIDVGRRDIAHAEFGCVLFQRGELLRPGQRRRERGQPVAAPRRRLEPLTRGELLDPVGQHAQGGVVVAGDQAAQRVHARGVGLDRLQARARRPAAVELVEHARTRRGGAGRDALRAAADRQRVEQGLHRVGRAAPRPERTQRRRPRRAVRPRSSRCCSPTKSTAGR